MKRASKIFGIIMVKMLVNIIESIKEVSFKLRMGGCANMYLSLSLIRGAGYIKNIGMSGFLLIWSLCGQPVLAGTLDLINESTGPMAEVEIKIEDIDEGVAELPDYFPIHEDSIGQRLSEIEVRNENLISKEQLAILQTILKENILAYKYGSAEAILADRLRAPYSIKPEATHWHLDILKRHYTKSNEVLPTNPEEIMRLLVNRRYHGENGSGYKDLYNEINVKGSHLDFYQTNKMPMPITDHLWILSDTSVKTFNNGVITPHPSIEYLNSPEKVLQKYGKLLYVDVSIAASDAQGSKYSRLKRYYWSEDDQVWLPMEIVSLRAKDRKADEFF